MKRGHKERDGNGYRKESLSTSINDETDFATDDDYPPTEEASTTSYDPHYTDGDHSLSYEQSLDTKSTEEIIFGFKKAVESGNDSLVMGLIEEYPSIDLLDYTFENGDNALHVAVRNKAYNLILYLITNGISPNEQNDVTLDTPLHTAVAIRDVNIVALLSKYKANKAYNLILYLITNGISPNEQNEKTLDTPLHTAVKIRDVNIVALLSKYRADPTISNKNYLTPLQIAIESKYEDIIELLSPETQNLVVENLQTYHGATNDVVDSILNDDTMFDDDIFPGNDKDQYEVKLSGNKRSSMKKPFSGMKRVKTQVALAAIHDITTEKNKLPTLAAWLEKKQDHMPYQWQKRWAIVKDSHILW
eukprot:CAMPEP_0201594162 /NCGR_PEP_ID=MMETSP0190_2-20130828/191558_1 /ASSEMBLY_ACC=CAM_ASM_000263 /TAXON_ID=37353 /ORGANISM="Rosalina sp." /LENGTH=360 /DNA_ID=CAMNT_0048053657 /DNA_START=87 /DNA_END=1166 /DNA_ORIENTATION=+